MHNGILTPGDLDAQRTFDDGAALEGLSTRRRIDHPALAALRTLVCNTEQIRTCWRRAPRFSYSHQKRRNVGNVVDLGLNDRARVRTVAFFAGGLVLRGSVSDRALVDAGAVEGLVVLGGGTAGLGEVALLAPYAPPALELPARHHTPLPAVLGNSV